MGFLLLEVIGSLDPFRMCECPLDGAYPTVVLQFDAVQIDLTITKFIAISSVGVGVGAGESERLSPHKRSISC